MVPRSMATHEERRIFISYAHRDEAQLAKRLQTNLTEIGGFAAPLNRRRIAGGAVWITEIEQEIDARPKHKLAGDTFCSRTFFPEGRTR